MAPTNTTVVPSQEGKKKRTASASSGEAQEVQGDAKRSCDRSSSFLIDSGCGERVNESVAKKWEEEFETLFRQQLRKDIDSMSRSLLSPFSMEDGAILNNLSRDKPKFFQGISQNAMEFVGEFFEDYYRDQMGHTFLEKEASKEHNNTPTTIGEAEGYDTGGATPSFVGEGYNPGGAEEET